MFLNRHEGDNFRSRHVAQSASSQPGVVRPATRHHGGFESRRHVFFFRLRTQSILEDQRDILVEVHSFVHNQRVATARSWGAEHLLGCSVEDLFVDPDYYGYCHGLSICL